jgi:hypothetical protein
VKFREAEDGSQVATIEDLRRWLQAKGVSLIAQPQTAGRDRKLFHESRGQSDLHSGKSDETGERGSAPWMRLACFGCRAATGTGSWRRIGATADQGSLHRKDYMNIGSDLQNVRRPRQRVNMPFPVLHGRRSLNSRVHAAASALSTPRFVNEFPRHNLEPAKLDSGLQPHAKSR